MTLPPAMQVLIRPKYLILTITLTIGIIIFAALLPNLHLVYWASSNSAMSLGQKLTLITSLIGSLQTNFTPLSRTLTIISALLIGIQTSLIVHYLKSKYHLQKSSSGASVMGTLGSFIDIGCAACGSVFLTMVVGISTTTAILSFMPFAGQEFSLIGISLLLVAIYLTSKKINSPLACGVERNL